MKTKLIMICMLLTYIGLIAQEKTFKDLIIFKDGRAYNGVHVYVNPDSLIVTKMTGEEETYTKKEVAEVMKRTFNPDRGFTDTVFMRDGTVMEKTQVFVTRDSVIVTLENYDAKIYKKSEVSEVKKNRNKQEGNQFTGKTISNTIGMELVEIPAGEFMMGCSEGDSECYESEKPAHKVKITKPFYMGKYEVTQAQWKAVMGNNPSDFKDCDNCPVENVSWIDCIEFLNKLSVKDGKTPAYEVITHWFWADEYKRVESSNGYRLPTEAEWEYAARAGSTTKYYWGNEINGEYLWYDNNSSSKTHSVGEKKPNAFGLHDMLGNVHEWCEDWYDSSYYQNSPDVDPKGSTTGSLRVMRGGSWGYNAGGVRSSFRSYYFPGYGFNSFGFRLVFVP